MLEKWMQSGRYLPDWMRDFHAQKDLFKFLWSVAENSRQEGGHDLDGLTWCNTHVYVIDIFLWIMAKGGWTLQRTRKIQGVEFRDIHADVRAFMDELRAKQAQELSAMFAKETPDA